MAHSGRFKPKNPKKYKGDPTGIIYRSSWEATVMMYCDKHPDVLEWSSEEIVIPYISPKDNRRHRYFPDFVIKRKGKDGRIQTLMVEVKPYAQTLPPNPNKSKTPKGRVSRRFLNEVMTYGINSAKWEAAEKYCKKKGWHFVKWTEHEIGIKK